MDGSYGMIELGGTPVGIDCIGDPLMLIPGAGSTVLPIRSRLFLYDSWTILSRHQFLWSILKTV